MKSQNRKRSEKAKFYFRIIIGMFIGFIAGYGLSSMESVSFYREIKPLLFFKYDFIFIIIYVLIGLFSLFVSYHNMKIRSEYSKASDRDELPTPKMEKQVSQMMIGSTFAAILSITGMGLAIALKHSEETKNEALFINLILAVVIFILVVWMQTISFKTYNLVFPERKYNLYASDPQKDLFQRMDEGEKWIVYESSLKTMFSVELALMGGIAFFVIYSIFIKLSIMPIIVLSFIWCIQKFVYFRTASRFSILENDE